MPLIPSSTPKLSKSDKFPSKFSSSSSSVPSMKNPNKSRLHAHVFSDHDFLMKFNSSAFNSQLSKNRWENEFKSHNFSCFMHELFFCSPFMSLYFCSFLGDKRMRKILLIMQQHGEEIYKIYGVFKKRKKTSWIFFFCVICNILVMLRNLRSLFK